MDGTVLGTPCSGRCMTRRRPAGVEEGPGAGAAPLDGVVHGTPCGHCVTRAQESRNPRSHAIIEAPDVLGGGRGSGPSPIKAWLAMVRPSCSTSWRAAGTMYQMLGCPRSCRRNNRHCVACDEHVQRIDSQARP